MPSWIVQIVTEVPIISCCMPFLAYRYKMRAKGLNHYPYRLYSRNGIKQDRIEIEVTICILSVRVSETQVEWIDNALRAKVYMETILGSASHTFRLYLALIGLWISPGRGDAWWLDTVYQFSTHPRFSEWLQIRILGKVCHSVGSYHQFCGLCQVLWSSKSFLEAGLWRNRKVGVQTLRPRALYWIYAWIVDRPHLKYFYNVMNINYLDTISFYNEYLS